MSENKTPENCQDICNVNYCFANRVQSLNPSVIREILKYAANPEVVSLSAGNPSPDAFPKEAIAEISNKILTERPYDALQYSTTEGYGPLREEILNYLKGHGIGRGFDNVLVTTGAQQAIELTMKILGNAGDTIIVEQPSFVGSLNSFRSMGGNLVGVPMADDGMDMAALEAALIANPQTKLIYTIPNFQNPSGITTSLEKREKILELATKYDVLILEDNPYGELRYSGENVPNIKSFDNDGRVIYTGSFSKVVASGLRVGYAVASNAIITKMVVCKQAGDVHTTILSQMICAEFMKNYDFNAHLAYLRELYSKKAALMVELFNKHLAPYGITHAPMAGGLFLWCALPEGKDMPEFCRRAVQEFKVAIVPGNAFYVDDSMKCQDFRINFSTPSDEDMVKGMERLENLAKIY